MDSNEENRVNQQIPESDDKTNSDENLDDGHFDFVIANAPGQSFDRTTWENYQFPSPGESVPCRTKMTQYFRMMKMVREGIYQQSSSQYQVYQCKKCSAKVTVHFEEGKDKGGVVKPSTKGVSAKCTCSLRDPRLDWTINKEYVFPPDYTKGAIIGTIINHINSTMQVKIVNFFRGMPKKCGGSRNSSSYNAHTFLTDNGKVFVARYKSANNSKKRKSSSPGANVWILESIVEHVKEKEDGSGNVNNNAPVPMQQDSLTLTSAEDSNTDKNDDRKCCVCFEIFPVMGSLYIMDCACQYQENVDPTKVCHPCLERCTLSRWTHPLETDYKSFVLHNYTQEEGAEEITGKTFAKAYQNFIFAKCFNCSERKVLHYRNELHWPDGDKLRLVIPEAWIGHRPILTLMEYKEVSKYYELLIEQFVHAQIFAHGILNYFTGTIHNLKLVDGGQQDYAQETIRECESYCKLLLEVKTFFEQRALVPWLKPMLSYHEHQQNMTVPEETKQYAQAIKEEQMPKPDPMVELRSYNESLYGQFRNIITIYESMPKEEGQAS